MVKSGARESRTRLDGNGPRYWPIEQYGVIGDCRTAALIAPNGSIDWLCLPHFDSQAVLCKVLDADRGGSFQVRPAGDADATMAYLPATNILKTTFESDTGRTSMLDFMPIRKRHTYEQLLEKVRQISPTALHRERAFKDADIGNDVAAAHRIDRILTCEQGEMTLTATLHLTPGYAQHTAHANVRMLNAHVFAAVLQTDHQFFAAVAKPMSPQRPDASAAPSIEVSESDGKLLATIRLKAGERVGLALNFARSEAEAEDLLLNLLDRDLDDDIAETTEYWRDWAAGCTYRGPYTDLVVRSALALKLCTFEPTGAIVAAPTTSLPEDVGGERNWDYRYTWLRDSSFTLQALGAIGYHGEARDYFHFLHDLQLHEGNNFRVLYTLHGKTGDACAEESLSHLEGYQGSRPVRVGNGAATQRQMDIYGELADAALLYAEALGFCTGDRRHESPRDLRHLLSVLADFIVGHWQERDRGIWEVRGPDRAFVYSRVMCWVALDRAMRLNEGSVSKDQYERWSATARAIRDDIHAHGYSEDLKTYTQAYDDRAVDAANFRIALVGYSPPDEPRLLSTLETTGRILQSDEALIYRYRPAGDTPGSHESMAADDGLSGSEGAFLACAFWYVSNLALLDRLDEARTRFERLLKYASPLGLFSEEVNATTGSLLGNYPQAFTHIGLINAAHQLRLAEERAQGKAEPEQECG